MGLSGSLYATDHLSALLNQLNIYILLTDIF